MEYHPFNDLLIIILFRLIGDPGQVYTCLIDLEGGKKTNVIILCCLSKRAEGLELFTPELDGYCQRLKERFQRLSVNTVVHALLLTIAGTRCAITGYINRYLRLVLLSLITTP